MHCGKGVLALESTNIRFEEGLDYGVVRSNSPEVVQRICTQSQIDADIVILEIDRQANGICAQVPLNLLAQGILFPENKGLRKMANSGGNGSMHISH